MLMCKWKLINLSLRGFKGRGNGKGMGYGVDIMVRKKGKNPI